MTTAAENQAERILAKLTGRPQGSHRSLSVIMDLMEEFVDQHPPKTAQLPKSKVKKAPEPEPREASEQGEPL